MSSRCTSSVRLARCALFAAGSLAVAGSAGAQRAPIVQPGAQRAPIVQPGAPGQASRPLTAEQAVQIANTRFTANDVQYMQDMIWHHQQAVEMAALVNGRTSRPPLVEAAGRISASQADEIRFMQGWLRERRQEAPDPAVAGTAGDAARAGHAGMAGHANANANAAAPAGPAGHAAHAGMPGMATPAQITELADAEGAGFDRLFLQRMIAHHQGAVTMSQALLRRPGAAYDPVLFQFANEVINEQQAEIERMSGLLARLIDDPRATLTAGLRDAGQAISNLALVATLPRPTGFFDPANPGDLPLPLPVPAAAAAPTAAPAGAAPVGVAPAGAAPAVAGPAAAAPAAGPPPVSQRSPLLSFANTDMAFAGNLLAVGSYHGFNLYRLGGDGAPQLVSSVICPGGQGDMSIVDNLLIMSVEQTRGRVDCGRQGVDGQASPERFRGLRIFDIGNPARPVQVGQVQTCRGSHTHSVVSGPDANGAIIVYVSGTSSVRTNAELAGCGGDEAGDRTALFRIDVVEIPRGAPSRARIIDSPAVFADPATGRLAGLWQGGNHGEGTQETNRTDQCHDITVFPSRRLAAGACSGNGIIFDISDPRRPRRIDAVTDPNFAYWHSATFNNDGTKVLFTDEWGGGARPRCRAQDQRTWGANAIYDIVDNRLRFRSHQKLPSIQTEEENCVAHNGSIIPVPGRDIFVQAWYQGGLSVIDFTDSANPVEIAYFDRGPISADHLVLGGYWSAYWYDGRIYATEIVRGLDVLALRPSQQLTANEIAAAALADQGGRFNPQQQFPVSWPHDPVIARAYLDQLQRSRPLPAATLAEFDRTLNEAAARLSARRRDPALAGRVEALAANLNPTGTDAAAARRMEALNATLRGIAQRLR